jgi:hypothetical protein
MEHLCVLQLETALAMLAQRLVDLRHHLKRQRYNDKVIERGFSNASEINRNDLEYKEKKTNKRVPLVLTYHTSLEKNSGIVRHHWKEIEKSETLAKLFPEPPVVAFRPVFNLIKITRFTDLFHGRSEEIPLRDASDPFA